MATATTFNTSIGLIPRAYEFQYSGLKRAIGSVHHCVVCQRTYTGSEIGTLACRFHPFKLINTCMRFEEYDSLAAAPTDCRTCNDAHLTSYARRSMAWQVPGSTDHSASGCTPVDHCTSLEQLLAKPYSCVPLCMAENFVLHDKYDRDNPLSTHTRTNVVIISEPEQMALTLLIEIPGTSQPFVVPVIELYNEVCSVFKLADLQQSVRLARRGPNASSITRIKGFQHADALDTYRLYADEQDSLAEFMPFAVIARVHPRRRLRLVDIPDLVNVLRDDELI